MNDKQQKIYIIAEMACSYDGSLELARTIVRDAAAAGADAISIHLTDLPSYMVRHYGTGPGRVSAGKEVRPIYDYLEDLFLSDGEWLELAKAIRDAKLDLIVMPNDENSLDFAKGLSPDAYVVSAACFEELGFIRRIGETGTPIYLRVGGATLGEIEAVVDTLVEAKNERVTLLYGHQNYPTTVADSNLNFLRVLRDTFGLPVGIADHIDADDDFATVIPVLAIPFGITCIEKHITYDRSVRGEDFESALNGAEFRKLVERVRKAEAALGPRHLHGLTASADAYRCNIRKRLVAGRDIKSGERLTQDMIAFKRADEGLPVSLSGYLIGRVARCDVAKDAGITFDLVSEGD